MATRSGQFGAIPLCGEILQRMSVDRPYANPLLRKVIAATVAVQIVIVMASLTVPVLASLIAPAAGIPPYLVGYYSALIYACAAATSFVTPHLLRRWGGVRIHQGADSDGSRPRFRDDVARHSDLISLGVPR
jgi:hypothetical protein